MTLDEFEVQLGTLSADRRRFDRSYATGHRQLPRYSMAGTRARHVLPGRGLEVLRAPRGQGRAGDDRQRLSLSLQAVRRRPRPGRHPARPNPTIHDQSQRQGRALHSDIAARMGLLAAPPLLSPSQPGIGPWIDAYNTTRPHAGIGGISSFQRLNNLLGNDT